ncbi:sensor histidine kinase [Catenuloplanes japonicus]|uniref:sensor histidine kinase n=1 Tax=Catenuloplanes japonicus TaxID=33876 RepID=UPI000689C768|nr:histidine kinase [Catenuloplanes japonicus]
MTVSYYDAGLAPVFVICSVQAGALGLALERPHLAAALHIAATGALAIVIRESPDQPWPLPILGFVSLGALLLMLGLRQRWTVPVSVWWLSILMLVGLVTLSPGRSGDGDRWGANLSVYSGSTVLLLSAAIAARRRGRIHDELRQARRDVELEQAQRRYVEERARIAREMHDVVAHSMSLVHMKALSAPFRLAGAPPADTDAEFNDIARSARAALSEMRQLLGVLRPDDGESTESVPQPQLADIAALSAALTKAGTRIDVSLDERSRQTSPIVQLTVYRVVQEALSNVVRHAPAARTRVRVLVAGDLLHVSVRNAPSTRGGPRPDRGGHGLRGMRERISLLGGDLTTGTTPDGGYAVEATVPITGTVQEYT